MVNSPESGAVELDQRLPARGVQAEFTVARKRDGKCLASSKTYYSIGGGFIVDAENPKKKPRIQ